MTRNHFLLEAAANENTDKIIDFFEEEYSSTDKLMEPGEELELLYVREYAYQNGHDDIGESAEEVLLSSNSKTVKKKFVQAYGGVVGFVGGFNFYDGFDGVNAFLEENGADFVAEASSSVPGEVLAGVSLALAGGYALGESYQRLGRDGVPVDLDGTDLFRSDVMAELREELSEEYGINTYCKDPYVPKRYHE